MLKIDQILDILPPRYPFLLVDRVTELEPGKRAVGLKNISANEEFFQGHFPGYPITPAVLIIEAMAQVGGILLLAMPEYRHKLPLFVGVDKAKFRQPVMPGDQLVTEAVLEKLRPTLGVGVVRTIGRVDGRVVAEALMMFALKDPNERRSEIMASETPSDSSSGG